MRCGTAVHGKAGEAWMGMARLVMVVARFGMAGMAGRVGARHGMARQTWHGTQKGDEANGISVQMAHQQIPSISRNSR